mmetsp:Transcript_12854/g.37732  ORF Transcript_12854/g.37732 Transcript_12854/m.37732 type:complete len:262 (-) Transcript_12854:300-1085(-)|eukprot:CAMPEP_0206061190 /NCGR_PEP_ID=MMETSP1466-20131121/53472_1 /ASSEMBLY_ACC=CAM_ASM_001126 /TAXON_ID=44452 /ORGANISM="Pavlova gyrans, Strain CCMP608" /LENGTH=261 /DNA_ID=CAMNT_0053436537 /DNA_START=52 /DNA_END=837 /DNA_ORIENTATION=-
MGAKCCTPKNPNIVDGRLRSDGPRDIKPNMMIRTFDDYPQLYVKQTKKGCIAELCACESNSSFKIGTGLDDGSNVYYASENSNCCLRTFCKNSRGWETQITYGATAEGTPVLQLVRPCRVPMGPCKPICRQEVKVVDAQNQSYVGSVKEQLWCCVPTFTVYDNNMRPVYDIHQQTCCLGCCSDITDPGRTGCCGCRLPWYVYEAGTEKKVAEINKVYQGWTTEICSDADTFRVKMPEKANYLEAAKLVSATLLINEIFYEF